MAPSYDKTGRLSQRSCNTHQSIRRIGVQLGTVAYTLTFVTHIALRLFGFKPGAKKKSQVNTLPGIFTRPKANVFRAADLTLIAKRRSHEEDYAIEIS